MKRGLLVLLTVLVVALAAIYICLPAAAPITYNIRLAVNHAAAIRCFTQSDRLRLWWPGSSSIHLASDSKTLLAMYDDLAYRITPGPFDVLNIGIRSGQTQVQSSLTLLPYRSDSALVTWNAAMPAGGTLSKWSQYRLRKTLQRQMAAVLMHLETFAKETRNVYALSINRTTVTDTLLAVTKRIDSVKPTPDVYYGLLKMLRTHIAAQGAQETNYPMLSVLQTGVAQWEITVALSINKPVAANGLLVMKRMVAGTILTADVRGGTAAVEEGFRQLQFYASEHNLRSPALPFQSLITDRLAERDTANWITKLYYPVL